MRCLLFVGIALGLLLIGMVLAAFICWMPVRTDDHGQVIDPTRTDDVIDPTLPVRTDDYCQVNMSMPGNHAGPPQWYYTENRVRRIDRHKGMFYVWPDFLSLAVLHNLSSATCNYKSNNHVIQSMFCCLHDCLLDRSTGLALLQPEVASTQNSAIH